MNYLNRIKSLKPYVLSYGHTNELARLEKEARHLCWAYNLTDPDKSRDRQKILTKLFRSDQPISVNSPFHCDYGFNIRFKGKTFFNYGDVLLDSSPIVLGKDVILAPHVCISCVGHPLVYKQRKRGMSVSKPIIIGDGTWIGANSFVRGGVKIGAHTVIGAGSVVTHDIPSGVVAVGIPCKVRRKITNQDLINDNEII